MKGSRKDTLDLIESVRQRKAEAVRLRAVMEDRRARLREMFADLRNAVHVDMLHKRLAEKLWTTASELPRAKAEER